MILALSPWLETVRDTSAVIGALAACLVAVHAAARLPFISVPVRWIGRTFFADPLDGWFDRSMERHLEPIRAEMRELKNEVKPNGGTSLRDSVDRTEAKCEQLERKINALMAPAE